MRLLAPIDGIVEDEGGADIAALREENRELRVQLSAARREAETAQRETAHALAALRKQLAPLYRALQAVFGELEAAGVEDTASHVASADPRWQSWKDKLGRTSATVIDALLLHGEMSAQQLASVCKMAKVTVYDVMTKKLIKNGLIEKNGGRYSLRQL